MSTAGASEGAATTTGGSTDRDDAGGEGLRADPEPDQEIADAAACLRDARRGGTGIGVNPEESELGAAATRVLRGPASDVRARLVEHVRSAQEEGRQ